MEEITRFVSLVVTSRFTVTESCADFHVSRKTAYKWLHRCRAEGVRGLQPRSRGPRGCAHRPAEEIERLILRERRRRPTWGPKKRQAVVRCVHRIKTPAARSTIAGCFAGLDPVSGGDAPRL